MIDKLKTRLEQRLKTEVTVWRQEPHLDCIYDFIFVLAAGRHYVGDFPADADCWSRFEEWVVRRAGQKKGDWQTALL